MGNYNFATRVVKRKKCQRLREQFEATQTINCNEAQAMKENKKETVQAKKSIRRMPRHWEPTKDVTNCDKLRGVVNKH